MVGVLASSTVDRGFDTRPDQAKDYIIVICCFSVNHATLRGKNKDGLARNQDNVSAWNEMSIHGLLIVSVG